MGGTSDRNRKSLLLVTMKTRRTCDRARPVSSDHRWGSGHRKAEGGRRKAGRAHKHMLWAQQMF